MTQSPNIPASPVGILTPCSRPTSSPHFSKRETYLNASHKRAFPDFIDFKQESAYRGRQDVIKDVSFGRLVYVRPLYFEDKQATTGFTLTAIWFCMIPQKTIKELTKELNEKTWYRLLKVLWVVAYIIFLVLFFSKGPTTKDFTDAIIGFGVITVSYLGATVALKRAVCYAVDYIVIGKVFLKEKWYSLFLIILWGILSIIIMVALFLPATRR